MKVDNIYIQNKFSEVGIKGQLTEAKQSDEKQKTSQDLTNRAVSMEISKKGFALAEELEPFMDTYDTTRRLLNGIGHISSQSMMNGDFANTLANNYQEELQKLKENYSGKEYDEQLAILDKAYEEATRSAATGYVKQLRLLTGDIVIKPQTAPSYATEADAERVYRENLKKDENREYVIDPTLANRIQDEVKNFLLQLKESALNQPNEVNNFFKSLLEQYTGELNK